MITSRHVMGGGTALGLSEAMPISISEKDWPLILVLRLFFAMSARKNVCVAWRRTRRGAAGRMNGGGILRNGLRDTQLD